MHRAPTIPLLRRHSHCLAEDERQHQRQCSQEGEGQSNFGEGGGAGYLSAVLPVGLYPPGEAFAGACGGRGYFEDVAVPPGTGAVAVLA
ncbi:MAG: hypothetical protein QOH93_1836 [Chloroflexia bacterium]|jgi:hypothetical protein|nr:hypothetical protein [Chloroflexia bacterium]